MYGTNERQIAASTLRAIGKKKPLTNAGAKPMQKGIMVGEPVEVTMTDMASRKPRKRYLAPGQASRKGPDMSAAMDRGIRKAMRLPLE